MDRVLEIDRDNLVVVTQPGVVNADLKKAVAAEGLFYAPDPASYETCTIGGNLGTNAGGLCCVKYGVTRDSVVGLEIVRADGSVVRLGGRTIKDVAGYGLIPLIVGSQGTLAIVTEATLRLRPTPPPTQAPSSRSSRASTPRVEPSRRCPRPASSRARSSSWIGPRSGRSTTPIGWAWTATRRRCC